MRRNLLLLAAAIPALLHAQKVNRVYAITSAPQGSGQLQPASAAPAWLNISEVDLQTGKVLKPVFENGITSYALYGGVTNRLLTQSGAPTATMVAASAYDRKRNRLFLAPMQLAELRWIDLDDNNTSLKVYTLPLPGIHNEDLKNEANHITRMTMSTNGYGYALSNDANHLYRFSSARKPELVDLGPLRDAAGNGAVSVHNRCSGWGGDMVSDANGDLYIVTAYQTIFKVDSRSLETSYIGTIKNLPPNFTTNGAAVDRSGRLIVSTAAVAGQGYYSVNMSTWMAEKMPGTESLAATSDLASSYVAFAPPATEETTAKVFAGDAAVVKQRVAVYPNPVSEGVMRVSFDNRELGKYNVQVLDVSGRLAFQQTLQISTGKQIAEVEVPAHVAKGLYLVKVVSAAGKAVCSDKIVIK